MDPITTEFFLRVVTPAMISWTTALLAPELRRAVERADTAKVRRTLPVDVLADSMVALAGQVEVPKELTWRELAAKVWLELEVEEEATSIVLGSPEHFDKAVATVLASSGVVVDSKYLDRLRKLTVVSTLRNVAKNEALAPVVGVEILMALWPEMREVRELAGDVLGELTRMRAFQSIEAVLAKGRETVPGFFREAGPLWADFDANLVAERRPQADRVIELLSREPRLCCLIEPSGGGKTVLARKLGYDLYHKGWFSFYARATTVSLVEMWREMSMWDKGQFLFIVDDCEDDPELFGDLLSRFVELENCSLLVLSRVPPKRRVRRGSSQDLHRVRVTPGRAVLREVVRVYERYLVVRGGYAEDAFPSADDSDLEVMWRKCGPDLWVVKWFLRSWDPLESPLRFVDMERVYARIAEDRLMSGGQNPGLLAVCALCQFGIRPTDRYLRTKSMPEDIEQLVRSGTLTQGLSSEGVVYGIHHPSLAQLYLEAAARFGMLEYSNELDIELDDEVKRYLAATVHEYLSDNPSQLAFALPGLRRLDGLGKVVKDSLEGKTRKLALMDQLAAMTPHWQRLVFGQLLKFGPPEAAPGSFLGIHMLETFSALVQTRHKRLIAALVEVVLSSGSWTERPTLLVELLRSLPPSVDPEWIEFMRPRLFRRVTLVAGKVDSQTAEHVHQTWTRAMRGTAPEPPHEVKQMLGVYGECRMVDETCPGLADRYLKRITVEIEPGTLAELGSSTPNHLLGLLSILRKADRPYTYRVLKSLGLDRVKALLVRGSVRRLEKSIRVLPDECRKTLWASLGVDDVRVMLRKSTVTSTASVIRSLGMIDPGLAQELLEYSIAYFGEDGRSPLCVMEMAKLIWAAREGTLDLPSELLATLVGDGYREKLGEADLGALGRLTGNLLPRWPRTYEQVAEQVSRIELVPAIATSSLRSINGFLLAMREASGTIRHTLGVQLVKADISAALEEASLRDISFLVFNSLLLSQRLATTLVHKWDLPHLVRSRAADAGLEDLLWMAWNTYQLSPALANRLLADDVVRARIDAKLRDGRSWLVRPGVSMAMVGLLDLCSDDSRSKVKFPQNDEELEMAQSISVLVEPDPSLIALSALAVHDRMSASEWSRFVATVDCGSMHELLSSPPSPRAKVIFDEALRLLCESRDEARS